MKPPVLSLSCRIVEGYTEGWDVYFQDYDMFHVPTATHALAHVTSMVRALDFSSVLTIEWEPQTSLGRSVVKVVTS